MYQSPNYSNLDSHNSYLRESSYNFTNVKKQAFAIIYIFILFFISVSILLYVAQVLNINQKSTNLLTLESKLESIEERNERLELKLAAKTSLAEVEKIAKNKLKMVEANEKETLVYNNQFRKEEKYLADLPKEKFFLAQIYDKIVKELITVQAKSLE